MIDNFLGRIIIFSFVGFLTGVLMLLIGIKTESIPFIRMFFDFLHMPASWFANFWSYKLELPPQNEAAFAIVPMVAVVLQWTLLGLFLSFWKK